MGTKVVQITISRKTASVTRAGFGVPLILALHDRPELILEYTEPSDMLSDGWSEEDDAYLEATYLMGQSPSPEKFKIGKLEAAEGVLAITVAPTLVNAGDIDVGKVVGITINGQAAAYTIQASDTPVEISAGVKAAVDALGEPVATADVSPNVDVSSNTLAPFTYSSPVNAGVTVVSGAPAMTGVLSPSLANVGDVDVGKKISIEIDGEAAEYEIVSGDTPALIATGVAISLLALTGSPVNAAENDPDVDVSGSSSTRRFTYGELLNCTFVDTTQTAGVASSIAAIRAIDDDWYGVATTLRSQDDLKSVAATVETMNKIASLTTHDAGAWDSGSSDDILSELQALGYVRSVAWVQPTVGYGDGSAILGRMLTTTPGSSTWCHQQLSGVPVSTFSEGELTAIENKNGNYFREEGGLNLTFQGITPGNEWIDTMRLVDWTEARMSEGVLQVLAANEKIPYSNTGIEIIKTPIRAVLQTGVANGGYLNDPAPSVSAPKAADISTNDKAARVLPDVKFTAYLAGAIHVVIIKGVVSL